MAAVLGSCDMIVDGLYEDEKKQSLGFAGSANQRLHFLTNRYIGSADYFDSYNKLHTEIGIGTEGVMHVGIPGRQLEALWRGAPNFAKPDDFQEGSAK